VYFPYTYIYPEQYEYMLSLKRALDAGVSTQVSSNPSKGSSLFGNAYRNWKNGFTFISDSFIPGNSP
jgi:hypothetical protein